MNLLSFFTNTLICTGAAIMAVNIVKYQEMIQVLKHIPSLKFERIHPILIFHQSLIILFFIGYLVVFYIINTIEMTPGNLLVGVIFFTGAIFVLLSIILKKKMITSIEAGYEDTLDINHQLSANQAELTQTNATLKLALDTHQKTEASLQRSYDTQTVVNRLLTESLTDTPIMDVLHLCLDQVLSLPWLSFESQGCIFLVNESSKSLVMAAQQGFDDTLAQKCASVPFGTCLCGRAVSLGETVFAAHMDERHEIMIPGLPDHGHYCLPIQAKGKTLGLINIYVKPGHERNEWEENFLKTIANTIAIILIQHQSEEQSRFMERRLNQSQKMESIGTLASGIAHDFNNILSGIFGHSQLAEMNLKNEKRVASSIAQINQGAKRASDLIQQILAFSRQTQYKKSPIKLYIVVKEALKFIRSSIPTTIRIKDNIQSHGTVKADPTQIHQIIMNLCTNAAHAMKETGGILTVNLEDIQVTAKDQIQNLIMETGPYLKLEIMDTGHGMTPEVLDKVFEPYFTTKEITEGTGLGLAVVLGIIQDHNGYIHAESILGTGSVFQVFLPLMEEPEPVEQIPRTVEIKGGNEHILVVDDEESILTSMTEMLEDFGYTISAFQDPVSAFDAYKQTPDQFDLMVTDVTMPGMTGDELSVHILDMTPDFPIILCTGYSDKISKDRALQIGIKKYLHKPFDSKNLLVTIRTLLDAVT